MISFSSNKCSGSIQFSENVNKVKLTGRIIDNVKDNVITYVAAAPCDAMASYSGSGLPFANPV